MLQRGMKSVLLVVVLVLVSAACAADETDGGLTVVDDATEDLQASEPDAPEPDLEARCSEDPFAAGCDVFLDSLSDGEFCRVLPDDDFCADLGDVPAAEADPADEPEPTPSQEAVCVANPDEAACAEFFDSLSDEEFCRVLPDDDFCMPNEVEVEATPTPELTQGDNPGTLAVAGIDPTLTRPDGQCLPEDAAESDQEGFEYNLAYQVVDGQLGAICFGSPDAIVEGAWRILADLTPPDQLRDLVVFAGITSIETDGETLAFVQRIDDDGTEFLMAVNIAATERDPQEATLTMAHEFSHVFTALPTELDRTVFPEDCTTFDNGEGCYVEESILNQWYQRYWLDVPGDPTDDSNADERCSLNDGFFGAYAASNPEEDFAEAFSAYVLQLEARTPGQQDRLDFIDTFPGLREFRDRAVALGYGPQENRFDVCG